MATKRKKWPHWAAWARDDAIAEATEALRDLEPVLQGRVDQAETIRRVGGWGWWCIGCTASSRP